MAIMLRLIYKCFLVCVSSEFSREIKPYIKRTWQPRAVAVRLPRSNVVPRTSGGNGIRAAAIYRPGGGGRPSVSDRAIRLEEADDERSSPATRCHRRRRRRNVNLSSPTAINDRKLTGSKVDCAPALSYPR